MTASFAVADHVTRTANRMQQRLRNTLINLRAQPRDVHVDDVGLRIEMVIPHVLEQHRAGHDLTGMLHEIFAAETRAAEARSRRLRALPGATAGRARDRRRGTRFPHGCRADAPAPRCEPAIPRTNRASVDSRRRLPAIP